jgi:hypothetical protein
MSPGKLPFVSLLPYNSTKVTLCDMTNRGVLQGFSEASYDVVH